MPSTAVGDGNAILFATVAGPDRGASHVKALSRSADASRRQEVVSSGCDPRVRGTWALDFLPRRPVAGRSIRRGTPASDRRSRAGCQPSRAHAHWRPCSQSLNPGHWRVSAQPRPPGSSGSHGKAMRRRSPSCRDCISGPAFSRWKTHRVVEPMAIYGTDTARLTFSRLTTESTTGNTYAVWTPDATYVPDTRWLAIDADRQRPLASNIEPPSPTIHTPSGLMAPLLSCEQRPTARPISIPWLRPNARPTPLVSTKAHEGGGQFSVAQWEVGGPASNESGQLQDPSPFPGQRKWLVAQAGESHHLESQRKGIIYTVTATG